MTEKQKYNLALLVDALRSGDYPKNPDVHGGRTIDGKYWHFGAIACEVYRLITGRGYWHIEDNQRYWDEVGQQPNTRRSWVFETGQDYFETPSPVWKLFGLTNLYEFEQSADFNDLADALERTFLQDIPTSGFLRKASTKGDKDYRPPAKSPLQESVMSFN